MPRWHKTRPQHLSNAEIWAQLIPGCQDIHDWNASRTGCESGLVWLAMFRIGQMWMPGKGATFHTYVRAWSLKELRRLYNGGGSCRAVGGMQASYAILTRAQRVFGQPNDLQTLEEVVLDGERELEFGPDELEAARAVLRTLPPRLRRVLELRMYGNTLREAGLHLGVGAERVRQLQDDALERARSWLARRHGNTRVTGQQERA